MYMQVKKVRKKFTQNDDEGNIDFNLFYLNNINNSFIIYFSYYTSKSTNSRSKKFV